MNLDKLDDLDADGLVMTSIVCEDTGDYHGCIWVKGGETARIHMSSAAFRLLHSELEDKQHLTQSLHDLRLWRYEVDDTSFDITVDDIAYPFSPVGGFPGGFHEYL